MSDYSVVAVWSTKDALATGQALKAVSATEMGTEFDAISTAIATKYDSNDRDAANGLCPLDASSLVPVGNLPAATESAVGVLEIATDAEAQTGAATDRILTPANLLSVTDLNSGIVTDLINLADPGADRIVFWDDSVGAGAFLTASTGLTLSGTNLTTNDAAIVHDSLSGFVANEHIDHSSVSVLAGNGLGGGGTIDANATLTLDIASLTQVEASSLASTDEFVVDNGGTAQAIQVMDMGLRCQTGQTSQTLAEADMNSIMQFSGTATLTCPNSTLTLGAPVIIQNNHASQYVTVALAASATLESVYHAGGSTSVSDRVSPGGTALLFQISSGEWILTGDIVT